MKRVWAIFMCVRRKKLALGIYFPKKKNGDDIDFLFDSCNVEDKKKVFFLILIDGMRLRVSTHTHINIKLFNHLIFLFDFNKNSVYFIKS